MSNKERTTIVTDRGSNISIPGIPASQSTKGLNIIPEYTIHRTDGKAKGPVFIHFPTSAIPGETAFLTTGRAKNAAHHTIEHPLFTNPKRSGERLDAVQETERFALDSESTLTLKRDFPLEPTQENYFSQDRILERLRRSTFLPAIPENLEGRSIASRYIREVLVHGNDDTYWDREGASLASQFDRMAFRRIHSEYDTSEPETFFDDRITESYQITQDLITDKIPEARRTWAVLTRAALASSPSEVVRYALAGHQRLQFETLRTLNVAEMLSISDKERRGLKPLVDRFYREISTNLFVPNQDQEAPREVPIYAIFDKVTGKPLWDSRTDSVLTLGEYAHYREVGILKEIQWNVQSVPITGDVFTDQHFKDKEATVEKMIRDAEERERQVNDDYVEPTGVTDLGGIMHVLMDETDSDGEKMNRFISSHIELARATFGEEVEIRIRDSKSSGVGKSDKHRFRRIDILVPKEGGKKKHKLEIIFVTLRDYLRNEYQVGTPDPQTGILNGPAHGIYEKIRRAAAARRMLPQNKFGVQDWNKIISEEVELEAAALAKEDQIPFDILMSKGFAPSPFAELITIKTNVEDSVTSQ